MANRKIKAVALISGGLDSALAAALVQEQGVEIYGVHFTSPFFSRAIKSAEKTAENLRIPIKTIELGSGYFRMLRKPMHGYGSALNPCIDCHTYMLKEAKKYANKIGAKFIVTGDVLGQRPMSQHKRELEIIDKDSGLKGKVLRPLSSKLLPETEAEKKGWIDVSQFPAISGRSRNLQFRLAKQFRLKGFSSPAGGCLLCHREFAAKVRDLLEHVKNVKKANINLLKMGRHFRYGKNKIIVGRDEDENNMLLKMKARDDIIFEADNIPSPITILQGPASKKSMEKAAELTAYYSDAKKGDVKINYGKKKLGNSLIVKKPDQQEVESIRIVWASGQRD